MIKLLLPMRKTIVGERKRSSTHDAPSYSSDHEPLKIR